MNKIPVWIQILLPVLCTFLLHELALMYATKGLNFSIFNPTDFSRWDSGLYLQIADKGYELMPCHEVFDSYPKTSTEWCGNVGWMPLYSYLIRFLVVLGLEATVAGYYLSKLFLLIVYTCLHILSKDNKISRKISIVLLAAIFPGSVYYDAVFPISLMLALVMSSYCLWKYRHQKLAMVAAFLIPLSYSTGFVVMSAWFALYLTMKRSGSKQAVFALQLVFAQVAGFACFFIIQKLSVDYWLGFFMIQAKYGHGFQNIFASVFYMLKSIWISGINQNWQNIQSLFFLTVLIISIVNIRQDLKSSNLFFNFYFIALAAFPILIGSSNLAQYRSQALLFPLLLILGEYKKIDWILIPVFFYFFISCSVEFFMGSIV